MMSTLRRWFPRRTAAPVTPSPIRAAGAGDMWQAAAQQEKPFIDRRVLMALKETIAEDGNGFREYQAPDLPPGVRPTNAQLAVMASDSRLVLAHGEPGAMALDSAAPAWQWLNGFSSYGSGLWFPGYPYLAELCQIAEYRAPSETISTEMTRKWVKHVSKQGDKAAKIEKIDARMKELKVKELFQRAALLDGEFGCSHLYMNIKDADERTRQLPLVIDKESIKQGDLRGFQCIEPYWCTPFSWNSLYPERQDFYKPVSWFVMGRKTHASRLLTFIGREVPDLLKPAYNFGGMSLTQLVEPYVNRWLRTVLAVNNLVNAFSIPILKTDMNVRLSDGSAPGSGLVARAQAFTATRNNLSVAIIQNSVEDMVVQNVPLGTLDKLQAQAQEHMAAPTHIPLIKLFGITPTGLNATGEGEIKVWYDFVNAYQCHFWDRKYELILKVVQLDLFGEIDDSIIHEWVPLDQPTVKELSEIRQQDATAGASYITNGVITPEEERERLRNDPDSGYNNLPAGAPEPSDLVDPEGEAQRDHESDMADADRQHQLTQSALTDKQKQDGEERAHERDMTKSALSHAQTQESNEQAAKLKPKPDKK